MKTLTKLRKRIVITLIALFMVTATYTAYSYMSGSKMTGSFRYRTNGMNYIILENQNGGVAVINLTKDAAEIEYIENMKALIQGLDRKFNK